MAQPQNEQSPRKPWWQIILIGRNPRVTLVRMVILIIMIFLARQYVILPITVQGISMLPTYKTGDINFVNRLVYKLREPQRGDIVAVRMTGEKVALMKRIVGLPGESVSYRRGKVYINGEPLDEPYVKLPCNWNIPAIEVEPGAYYVVGDNRSMASRDHDHGRAYRRQIIGKVMR